MTRRLLAPPSLDLDALEREVAVKFDEVGATGVEILTHSQAALQDAEKRVAELQTDGRDRRKEIARTKKVIADLQAILVRMEAHESDGAVELQANLNLIDSLRKAGVSLPDKPDVSGTSGAGA